MQPTRIALVIVSLFVSSAGLGKATFAEPKDAHVQFNIRSAMSGDWSNPKTWTPQRLPKRGDRVLISPGHGVKYDVQSKEVIRLLQVVGTLTFTRDRSTELNVGILKVQNSTHCTESGFACDFHDASGTGEPLLSPKGTVPSLIVGTPEEPIPSQHTARIRLHYLDGFDKKSAPAIACCSARMEFHGAPMSRTWVKLEGDTKQGATRVKLATVVRGWKKGDEVIVTGSGRKSGFGSFRPGARRFSEPETEQRRIAAIDGRTVTLDQPLKFEHLGAGEFRCEVANLSRNVIVESAKPDGVRGHTVYHRFSRGGISYAAFRHLGKEGVLGRYAIHFHLVGDTMRGSQVLGASIVDSHNRWVTIHGTQYLVVRDCVGYKSVGHGFFLEDATEVYNLLDRNLGVHAYRARRLPDQVLPFDLNDGAAFWWANGRNSFTRNVAVESDQYGYRYDIQHSRRFDTRLPILQPDGSEKEVDVRTIGIWRFEDNEAHGSFAGMVVAANGGRQPDYSLRDQRALAHIRSVDWTGPDIHHPHVIRNFKIWQSHYAFRPHSPAMLMENVRIHRAAYGIYRPAFENHVYRNLHISAVAAEPFNRGMDDASAQTGSITVDGLTFETGYGNKSTPLVQMSDNDLSGDAETHFRNVKVIRPPQFRDRWPLLNRGVGPRAAPVTKTGVPYFLHDYYGPGRHAKVVSTAAKDLLNDGNKYRSAPPLTGNESQVAEVKNVAWPKLLKIVDDVPPATIVTRVERKGERLLVAGVSHDNGPITSVTVNKVAARIVANRSGVVDWQVTLDMPKDGSVTASARDKAGNIEKTQHRVQVGRRPTRRVLEKSSPTATRLRNKLPGAKPNIFQRARYELDFSTNVEGIDQLSGLARSPDGLLWTITDTPQAGGHIHRLDFNGRITHTIALVTPKRFDPEAICFGRESTGGIIDLAISDEENGGTLWIVPKFNYRKPPAVIRLQNAVSSSDVGASESLAYHSPTGEYHLCATNDYWIARYDARKKRLRVRAGPFRPGSLSGNRFRTGVRDSAFNIDVTPNLLRVRSTSDEAIIQEIDVLTADRALPGFRPQWTATQRADARVVNQISVKEDGAKYANKIEGGPVFAGPLEDISALMFVVGETTKGTHTFRRYRRTAASSSN